MYCVKESKQSFYSMKNPLIINLKGKLRKSLDFFLRCQTRRILLAHFLVEISRGVVEELVSSTVMINHKNMMEPYMEVLIFLVLQEPMEKYPTVKTERTIFSMLSTPKC